MRRIADLKVVQELDVQLVVGTSSKRSYIHGSEWGAQAADIKSRA